MPLIKGPKARTKPAMKANYKTEAKSKPKKQAVAIMLSLAGKSTKKHKSKK